LEVHSRGVALPGTLAGLEGAAGIVLFAHGSGSSRHSPRNTAIASELNGAGFATLLFDLLTADEEQDHMQRFDIAHLSQRLADAARQMRDDARTAHLPMGLFGASTGAAAALNVAAELPQDIDAVVSRGGRPDLAEHRLLARVRAPTLLIVGGHDTEVIALNNKAYALLSCRKHLSIVPGATHLFEEAGALAQVAKQTLDWFSQHLREQ